MAVETHNREVADEVRQGVQRTQGRTVLVVDDDPGVLEVLELALTAEGYHVVLARNGREGLDRADASHPSLMLVDLMMPVMDGWQFVRACRERGTHAGTPVIILSAARNVEQTVQDLGVQAVLSKPFNLDYLLDLVATHAA
jgi:two-component system, chemotaxis family, chemotaxis protein CheY